MLANRANSFLQSVPDYHPGFQQIPLVDYGTITSFIIHYRVEAATPREDETEADG